MAILAGIHPVREALKSGRPLARVHLLKGQSGPRIQELVDLAREGKVPIRFEDRAALDRLSGGVAHQGAVALASATGYASLEEVIQGAELLVVLDGVEDPHNLGAIIRTANAAGADAVVIPERRAAPLTETVERSAAGALAHTPVVRVVNVNQTLEKLKDAGFWIYGLDERGTERHDGCAYNVPVAFVMGAEGKGLHQLTAKKCDALVRIPMFGEIASLNVSVATGVVLFEFRRRFPKRQDS